MKKEALNKALKKWLLILRSKDVVVNGPLLKKKSFKFTNELNIEILFPGITRMAK